METSGWHCSKLLAFEISKQADARTFQKTKRLSKFKQRSALPIHSTENTLPTRFNFLVKKYGQKLDKSKMPAYICPVLTK
jgi:hypothetical protein